MTSRRGSFTERALLADEMGLGKTIQAIAACALLHHLRKARRVLVVAPASLKSEWEEQIRRFTDFPLRLVFGGRAQRARLYADPDSPFFTVSNYEQIVADSLDINSRLRPDIVVLDEAQRIKNWSTKAAQAVKRLKIRYAFLLNMLRMICDSPGIMKGNPSRDCPKLDELARVLDECLEDSDVKVIVFSEWVGMLDRVRAWADSHRIGHAWHTGSVPQKQRRAEILAFRQDPHCRLFLSTDSGGVGLNLQNASIVINCDLPWNPARLEQRIARAWRKNQLRPVTVVNLVAEGTIEHGMLASLSQKMELSQGVLDGAGDLSTMTLKSGRQAVLKRLEQVMVDTPTNSTTAKSPPADPATDFAIRAKAALGDHLVQCDETWIRGSPTPVILAVLQDGANRARARRQKTQGGQRPACRGTDRGG